MELVIGTRKWSSWSMRPWLALRRLGAEFSETLVPLRQLDTSARLEPYSPAALAPVLRDGDLVVWDSLAICEYLNDRFPEARLWPRDLASRALGRSAMAQMHSGFASLRGECPMDLTAEPQRMDLTEATQNDVRRMVRLWSMLRTQFAADGPFLLGSWSIADAYYTPVATRFRTYGVRLSDYGDGGACGAYGALLLEQADYLEWERLAKAEG
jgi:glutathione S-transferase